MPTLTPTEQRVLQLVADGHTNQQAAKALNRSPNTIKHTLARIQAKLHTTDRCTSVVTALRTGLIR